MTLDPNQTVRLKIDGQDREVTLKELQDSYQTSSALAAREASLNGLRSKAESYDQMEQMLLGDPDGFVKRAHGMAAQISGKRYTLVGEGGAGASSNGNGQHGGGEGDDTPAQDPTVAALQAELAELKRTTLALKGERDQSSLAQRIESAIASDPILSRTDGLKTLARTTAASVLASEPNRPLDDVLQRTRALVTDALTESATQTVTTRENVQQNSPHVGQQGSPQTAEEYRPKTRAEMGSPEARSRMRQMAENAGLGSLFREPE